MKTVALAFLLLSCLLVGCAGTSHAPGNFLEGGIKPQATFDFVEGFFALPKQSGSVVEREKYLEHYFVGKNADALWKSFCDSARNEDIQVNLVRYSNVIVASFVFSARRKELFDIQDKTFYFIVLNGKIERVASSEKNLVGMLPRDVPPFEAHAPKIVSEALRGI